MTTDITMNDGTHPFSRLMIIYSPAGGNGKSEIAANLAFMLAKAGRRIWIIDANTYAPTMDLIFNFSDVSDSFIQFISSPELADLPMYNVSRTLKTGEFTIYLTPAGDGDRETRRDILEKAIINDDFISCMQEAIVRNIKKYQIDLCIIDTHPGFEQINNVWFGLTSFLFVVSRMNDLDLRNLGLLLQDITIADIEKKLVVFNNVQYRNDRVSHDLENREMLEKFKLLINGDDLKKELTGSFTCNGNLCGTVEFFPEPFLYSRELSLYQQSGDRKSFFSEIYPDDTFSISISDLASFILQRFS